MFRLNTANPAVTGVSHGHSQVITQQQTHHISQQSAPSHQQHSLHQHPSHQPLGSVLSQLDAISVSGSNGPNDNSIIINETILTAVKAEPMLDTASTSSTIANGHVLYTPIKRPRLEGNDDWLSSPSPGSVPSSVPPLSPSPGSQSHNCNTTMSNGYSSPMSNGSYDPYSPNGKIGLISFVSVGYGGRASDKFITEKCDVVVADRGFLVENALKDVGARAEIPAFTKGKSQLNPYEIETTRNIANVRIHVEREIGLLRLKYTILAQRQFPLHFVRKSTCTVHQIDQIVVLCAALINLCQPICVRLPDD